MANHEQPGRTEATRMAAPAATVDESVAGAPPFQHHRTLAAMPDPTHDPSAGPIPQGGSARLTRPGARFLVSGATVS